MLLDRILVIDLEATCWKSNPPKGEEQEIIEIGIAELEVSTGKCLSKKALLVKPERSRVSPFCTSLTTLTEEQLKKGTSFTMALSILKKKYHSTDRVWASWGNWDRGMFEKQCQSWELDYPFGRDHINIKTLFALSFGLTRAVGTSRALEMAGLEFEGTPHRGVDDAWNTAKLLSLLLFCDRGK